MYKIFRSMIKLCHERAGFALFMAFLHIGGYYNERDEKRLMGDFGIFAGHDL